MSLYCSKEILTKEVLDKVLSLGLDEDHFKQSLVTTFFPHNHHFLELVIFLIKVQTEIVLYHRRTNQHGFGIKYHDILAVHK